MVHGYDVGTRAWQPDATEGWVASEVLQKKIKGDKVKLVFQLHSGEVRSMPFLASSGRSNRFGRKKKSRRLWQSCNQMARIYPL